LLLEGDANAASAWNFGPDKEGNRPVLQVLETMKSHWPAIGWFQSAAAQPHEANLLYLDSSKARDGLGWRPIVSFAESVEMTISWYREFIGSGAVPSARQLQDYCETAVARGVPWSKSRQ
jgi:CDP-glucose 4,6-dehydratase